MDLADLPVYLEALKKAASDAAPAAANAMASAVKYQVQNVALKQVAHGSGMFWKAAPMRPPAYASGALSRSITLRPASASVSGYATASVFTAIKYAAVQEWGSVNWPSHGKYMKWENSGGVWYRREVTIPPHPYWRPTVDRLVRNGDLTREAKTAFWVRVMPYFQG